MPLKENLKQIFLKHYLESRTALDLCESFSKEVVAAVLEEREQCAKIADASKHGKVIAHNIRARK